MIARLIANLPLKRKLTLVIVVTCTVVLLLACGAIAIYEVLEFRRTMVRDATVLADILGKNTQAALAFQDADGARGLLRALQAEPHVVGARVYDRAGEPFADYARDGAAASLPAHARDGEGRFEDGHLALFRPIELDGKAIGTIYLQLDLQEMYDRLGLFAGIGGLVLAGSFLLALVLSSRLQRPISRPILALAETARMVAERQDYTVRAPRQGRDEVGALTDAFNHMLARIHGQNQALREGEERMRAVLNCALTAVVAIDAQGRVIDWNARAEAMFGRTRDEVLGQELATLIIPEHYRDPHRRGLAHYLEVGSGPVVNRLIEVSALRRDGVEFPVELSVSPMKAGEVTTFCGFITDITERKLAAAKVQAQMARLDLLNRITRAIGERQDLPSIFQVVIRNLEDNLPIDFGCACLYDGAASTLTVTSVGLHSEKLATELAMPVKATIPIDQNGLSRCVSGELVYEPDIAEVPFPFPQRLMRGGLRSLVAVPLVVESQVFGVLIAARKAADSFSSGECEFLRQLADQVALAAHQTQLYSALQQAYDDLRQSQQTVMQQERLRALGQMASGIAHDINNAISPVALYTESLLEKEPSLSERARSYLETIKRAIEDVAHTVARMREFYRQRETQLVLTPVDVNQMVQQVLDLTRARWSDMPQQRGVVIEAVTELAPGLPPILGIPSEVREALINLVFNAVDALPEGGTVTLRTRFAETPAGASGMSKRRVVQVEVADTGVGMDEETRRRCLEPFFTTKGERGTGLGLAMVYGVLQRHNADIEIDSELQRGTTIRLSFPVPAVAPAEAESVAYAQPKRLRMLVIDDDPILLKSLRDILEAEGHMVTVANHGQAGIDVFRAAMRKGEPFGLVMTDLGMPYVDGRKVASTVKEESPTTPVIMLTGWGQRLVAEGEVPPHVDHILNKPPKLTELRTALARCCRPAQPGKPD
jgi:PAS domain S-box-containing protein